MRAEALEPGEFNPRTGRLRDRLRWLGLLDGEWFSLGASHAQGEGLTRLCGARRRARRGVMLALPVMLRRLADDVNDGCVSRARQRGVCPLAGEVAGPADHRGPGQGVALGGVSSERVGVPA